MLGLGRRGEGPTESSDVCDFPALGEDCEGPAGLWLWIEEEQKRERHKKKRPNLTNLQFICSYKSTLFCLGTVLIHESGEEKVIWGKEL